MNISLLLLFVVLIFKYLFNSFGNINEKDISERDKILQQLSKMMNTDNTKDGTIKKICVISVNETEQNKINQEIDFINTTKKVVEAVNSAFSNNDENALSGLLSDNLFFIFKQNIDENLRNNRFLKTIVVSFDEVIIINNNVNSVNIKVVMNQINYIQDQDGNFISGDKSKVVKVAEIWEFVRNNNNLKPAPWLVNNISEYNV